MAKTGKNLKLAPKADVERAPQPVTVTGCELLHSWSLRFTFSDGQTRDCIVNDADGQKHTRDLLRTAVLNTIQLADNSVS